MTFEECLKKYEFTDFEDDEGPIISSMYHRDDVIKAVTEWLTEKRVHFINRHKFCDDVKQSMDELLAEIQGDIKIKEPKK
jgi:hypothetical protein